MSDEHDIEYEAAPTVVELDGNEAVADAETFARACGLLRLYTSAPYLAEASSLLGQVGAVFESWPDASRFGTQTKADWTVDLRRQHAALERGLTLLRDGRDAAAYESIAAAVVDGLEPLDLRDERHLSLYWIVASIGEPVAAVGKRLGAMASRIDKTLTARWAYQSLPTDPSPETFEPPRLVDRAISVASGRAVPKTGIWMPTTIRYGCPNFLIAGRAAPPLTRAGARYDYYASRGEAPPKPTRSLYDYVEEPTVWRLVWSNAA